MNQLAASAITFALASIWLGASLAVAAVLLFRAIPALEARWRYRIWVAVLGLTLLLPASMAKVAGGRPLQAMDPESSTEQATASGIATVPPAPRFSPTVIPAAREESRPSPEPVRRSQPARLDLPETALTLTGSILLLGALIGLLRIPFELRSLGRLKRRADFAPEELRRLWGQAIERLPSRRALRLRISDEVTLPVACGYFRPAVLVPLDLQGSLSEEETRHLLLHERAHLVRGDDWDLLVERIAAALCWWNPAVWWITRRLEQEREEACDQLVAHGAERRRYARTLVRLAEMASTHSSNLAPGATRGQLTRRVEALLSDPGTTGASLVRRGPAVLLAGAVLITATRLTPPHVGVQAYPADSAQERPPVSTVTITALDSLFTSYADSGFSGTILLARRGQILLQKGYGLADRERGIPATADTRYSTAGMTKLFTAAALLELAEQGKLTLQDSLSRWIESLSGGKGAVTLDQLLTYRDGLTRLNAPVQRDDREDFVRAVSLSPASFTPGTGYRYSDHGHSLLGLVIEKAAGEEYESYIHRRFLQPAGLSQTGFENEGGPIAVEYSGPATALQPVGRRAYRWGRRASLGLVSTAGDLYRWFQELSDSTAVSPAVRRQLFQVRTRTDYNSDQAYGLELIDRGQGHRLWRRVAGTPGFEGELLHDPDNDWTAVILVNTRLGWRFRVWREIERAMWQPQSPNPSS